MLRLVSMQICEDCLLGKGECCNTPGCIFIRMRPPEWELDPNQYTVIFPHGCDKPRLDRIEEPQDGVVSE